MAYALDEDIRNGNWKRMYLLYGEESYLKTYYKNKIRRALISDEDTINLNVYRGRGIPVSELIDQAETMPFFAEHRLIIIEDSGFFKSAADELTDYLPGLPAETILLFVETEVDKRGRLFKTVKKLGSEIELKHLDEKALTGWILRSLQRDGVRITRSGMELFLRRAGDDMENIRHELDKLVSYTWERREITADDVEAICAVRTENRIFDMLNALAEKKRKEALELYYDLLSLKEPPMRILALMARQFHVVMQVKELREQGFDQAVIASRAGVPSFTVRGYLRQAECFSMETIRNAVEDCVKTDEAVKTGRIGDRLGVEILIVKYSSRQDGD